MMKARRFIEWIVLKVAQRCNLNCDYCYIYHRGDDSWKSRPRVLTEDVAEALARRISEHGREHAIRSLTVEFHGGEPLLIGAARLQDLIDRLRKLSRPVELRFHLQTNGLLLDREWLELFVRNGVKIGISLDGPPEIADRHRVFHSGRGSTEGLLELIGRLRREAPLFDSLKPGYLCVIDPEMDGAEMVRWFASRGFSPLDFLLPDGTHANLPAGWRGAAPYLRFLLEAFDQWYAMGDDAPSIRIFESMIMNVMGSKDRMDFFGGDLARVCVVETDGTVVNDDVSRICVGASPVDPLNVFDHPLDAVSAGGLGVEHSACAQCRSCVHFKACGGGYLPHRYDGRSFDNPSIYCEALFGLAGRITEVLRSELPATLWTAPQNPG